MPGAAAETGSRRGRDDKGEGLKGLKALGVRDLNYRMAFLACGVSADGKFIFCLFETLFDFKSKIGKLKKYKILEIHKLSNLQSS